jgi:BirA family biotin operon repressor/biotin-[acetyl-CoA-carboxylase] ligase
VYLDERTRARLAGETRFADIRLVEVTDSTNRQLLSLAAAGAPEGLVMAADLQTAGRGRLDRTWEARAGDGLLVSVLLRPWGLEPPRWHLLTAAAALAARHACYELGGFVPDLKWPNDLTVAERKLAGILAESSAVPLGTSEAAAVVVGMGLNVHGGPPGSSWADAVAGRRLRRSDLLVSWLESLERLLRDWDGLADSYRANCSTVGRRVNVQLAGGTLIGLAEGIDESGCLLVRPEGSRGPVAVAAGDVVHLRDAVGG